MSKTRFFLLFFALALALALPAAAAPLRDAPEGDLPDDEGLRGFLSTVMSAAMVRDLPVLEEGEAPSQELWEAVFAVFEYNNFGLDSTVLTEDECASLYRGFFAEGEFAMPREGSCPCVRFEDGRMILELAELNETPLAGAHVTAAADAGNGRVLLKADLYTAWGYYMTDPGHIPSEDLTWYASAEICAEAAEGGVFGWRLVSYRIGEVWQDGALSDWPYYENEADGYSLYLPSRFGLSGEDGDARQWQTPDGKATLTVRKLAPMTYEEGLEMTAGETGDREGSEFFGYIRVAGQERAVVLFCGEEPEFACLVILEYPAANADEYIFYSQIIRNSMWVRGMPNG